MNEETFEVTTVFIPVNDMLGWNNKHSDILSQEAIDWLNKYAGNRAPSYFALVAYLDEDNVYGWSYNAKDHDPQTMKVCYSVSFKNAATALMFKLTWGGV